MNALTLGLLVFAGFHSSLNNETTRNGNVCVHRQLFDCSNCMDVTLQLHINRKHCLYCLSFMYLVFC